MSSLDNNKWARQQSDTLLPFGESIGRFEVQGVTTQGYLLRSGDDEPATTATCAVSCLLEPIAGDQVLAYRDTGSHEVFILAVLTRSKASSHRSYAFSEAARLDVTGCNLKLQANSMQFEANEGDFKFKRFRGDYDQLSETANSVTLVAGELTQTIGRFWGRFRDFFKRVEGLDRTQASNIEQTAEHQLLLRSDFTKIRAKHVVKVDANKIDLG